MAVYHRKPATVDAVQWLGTNEEEMIQLRRQMESLRFMWNQKNEESERQRKSLEALEKLNYSLSQKLEELRKAHRNHQQSQELKPDLS